MLKLLIVEDEKWEREGLVDFLDWKSFDIAIAGIARDGIDGYEQALNIRPDIVLTDIKMPGMDGIEMSKKLKGIFPNIKIIILTGYDDFKYAKEAIDFNANAYVLKPFEEHELIPVVRKVADLCRKENEKARWEKKVISQLNKSRKTAKINMLLDWISGKISYEDIRNKLEECGVCVSLKETYIIAIIKVYDDGSSNFSTNDDRNKLLINDVGGGKLLISDDGNSKLITKDEGSSNFSTNDSRDKLTINDVDSGKLLTNGSKKSLTNSQEITELIKQYIEQPLFIIENSKENEIIIFWQTDDYIKEMLNNFASHFCHTFEAGIIFGIGKGCNLLDISISYNQAKNSIAHQIFWDDYSARFYDDIHRMQESIMERANEFIITGDYFSKQFIHAVSAANEKRVFELLDEFFEFTYSISGSNKDFIINFIKSIINDVYVYIYTIHNDFTKKFLYEKMWKASTIIDLKQKMKTFLENALSVQKNRLGYDEQIVKNVINIIEQRYMTPLSLKVIANEVYISPNYLGNIFKNYTGKPFNDFLCEYRMEKAKKLLKIPSIKVNTVADKVGFQNPSYFCTVFKSTFGVAPGEYQKSNII